MAFDIDHFLVCNWEDYFTYANNLADQIIESGGKYDRIVGITRGGLTLSHFLSDALSLPVSMFTIKSYEDIGKQGEAEITEELSADISGKNILLVDEFADTGKTFVKADFYLSAKNPKSIKTAAIFYKPHSVFKPDFHVAETSKWVLFPNEFTESAVLLKNMLQKENLPVEENLLKLGYKEKDLELLKKRKVI